jgi:hypothetical protein
MTLNNVKKDNHLNLYSEQFTIFANIKYLKKQNITKLKLWIFDFFFRTCLLNEIHGLDLAHRQVTEKTLDACVAHKVREKRSHHCSTTASVQRHGHEDETGTQPILVNPKNTVISPFTCRML